MTDPSLAVVAGLGPGLGAALCRRFAREGYRVVGLARHTEVGAGLAEALAGDGARMAALACDVTDPDQVRDTFARIEDEHGRPDVLVYNASAFLMKPFIETGAEEFLATWAATCFGGFLCARDAAPAMVRAGRGTIIFTGATASVRPAARFAAFGSAKSGLRGLAQALARELGPWGVHVAHVVIDGVIWTPRTRELIPGLEERACLQPEAVAEAYLQLIRQDRSAWTHELDLRPDREPF
ncbi:MAG: SDR family NAD(P)-dependent oxidoreductase [Gammaproteobacteria bacterium]|nr:SDR family NAD(P)-dependent oxidoreductase [Gammaproteobacteria bacterium]